MDEAPSTTLDLDVLRTLATIAKHESFGAAAIHLDCTQSAITQQMQRLEAQIGQPIFEKQGRQKRLTMHGQRLLSYANHMLAINDEALRNLKPGGIEGVLRIGAPHDVADTMLVPLLIEVAHVFPLIRIDIHVGRSPFLLGLLKRGDLDMAIANRTDSELKGVVLRTSQTVWLCAAGYVHDISRPIPLIVADGPSIFKKLAHEALESRGLGWQPLYTSSNLIGIRAALRAGLGVTARGVEQVDGGLRVLSAADGMPALPEVVYRLYVRSHVVNPLTRQVFDLLSSRQHLLRKARS